MKNSLIQFAMNTYYITHNNYIVIIIIILYVPVLLFQ